MGQFDTIMNDYGTALIPASRTATSQSATFENEKARGIHVTLDVTAVTAGQNEVQSLTVVGDGGTYRLTFNGQTTSPIAFNADAATVETALRGLSSINGANVNVVPSGPGFNITFVGTLAASDQPQISSDPSQLTGTPHSANIATVQQGSNGSNVTLFIQGVDKASGKSYTLLTGAQINMTGTTTYRLYPGLTAMNNATVSDGLPRFFNVKVTHATGSPTTYSVGYNLLG